MAGQSRASPSTGRRVERSCVICHRRKVRCDKQSPCSQCSRGGYTCLYPQTGPPVRRVRKTTITDVASRISELEKTLITVSREQETKLSLRPFNPAPSHTGASQTGRDYTSTSHTSTAYQTSPAVEPPGRPARSECTDDSPTDEVLLKKGSSSQYFNEVLFSRVIEQEHDVRSALSTPRSQSPQQFTSSPFNLMGILSSKCFEQPLTCYLPTKLAAMQLWRVYVDSVDPCIKILHIPTDEISIYTTIDDPNNASTEVLAVCYAVYFAATVALEPAEVANLLEDDKYSCLYKFKKGVEQAFARGEFLEAPTVGLLQALAIYSAAVRVHNSGRGIWVLNGLATRAAESIGLHRDGKKLNLSPFESEIRRRLWWHLVARDGRAAEDHGLNNTYSPALMSGVDLPLNLEDVDLYPEMKELPPPRAGWTRMTLALVNIEVARVCGKLLQPGPGTGTPRELFRAQVVSEAKDKMAEALSRCNYVIPRQRMTIKVAQLILRKLDLVSRQRESVDSFSGLATEDNLLEALSILEESDNIWSDDLLRPFRWSMRAYPQFHMMLYILWYLCVRPQGSSAARALEAVGYHLEKTRTTDACATNESKWMVLAALKSKAISIMNCSKGDDSLGVDGACLTPQPADDSMGLVAWKTGMETSGEQEFDNPQGILDWRTLLEDFQLDATDLSIF
ncbi:hypothetical protein BGZ61DRAFT_376263 [Ilyonectria robusta]|uniref:uncharacterized protein n=1 Tax=Ilyonectria robusta TaxID=1079257 RepID=UPI001E8D7AF8|nr:uncharacterized protein BGZ61DRAFT_376263 [Ilyonectria robusta]KAH8648864.1 hypothetical protein BGZ61DRAFT_376263 [Ilyonectria robusta]